MALLQSLNIPHEIQPEAALSWFQRSIFSDIPPHFLTHWKTGKKFFYGGDGLLAFEETPDILLVAGEPVLAAHTSDRELWRSFHQLAERRQKAVQGYCFGVNWYSSEFRKKPFGSSLKLHLSEFDLQAANAKGVSRALKKGQQLDYNVIPVYQRQRENNQAVQALFKSWQLNALNSNSGYFHSQPSLQHPVASYEEWFIVERDGEAVAFCSLLPYLVDGELGFYLDHLIHDPKKHPQALGFLMAFLIEILKEEGVTELNFGFHPEASRGLQTWWVWLQRFISPLAARSPLSVDKFESQFAGVSESQFWLMPKRRGSLTGLFKTVSRGFAPRPQQMDQEV